jgi:hypothetical protein
MGVDTRALQAYLGHKEPTPVSCLTSHRAPVGRSVARVRGHAIKMPHKFIIGQAVEYYSPRGLHAVWYLRGDREIAHQGRWPDFYAERWKREWCWRNGSAEEIAHG